ncbi:hypothetical protein [Streptomyces sp. NPDC001843]|uniref:hypothetical protein n=1 Tax=Streptomyces sp. NPDC001843 TaxID=3364617 RepID=UPI0036CE19DE
MTRPGQRVDIDRVILPATTRRAVHQQRPVVVVGNPVPGKTTLADLIAVYKSLHRHYASALTANVRTAGSLVRPDTAPSRRRSPRP